MTTDRPRSARLTATELRLYVVAVLAGLYLVTWRAMAATVPAAPPAPAPRAASTPTAIWIDDVPVAARPAVTPPPGWRVAGDPVAPRPTVTAAPDAGPRLARVPAPRARRVRTRSS